ncbi:imprinted and ancient [Macrolepiota fuliginosa MF-IS2]|uniref:Imprinted and ancient n=1 Tax=Macrolepiota fuliginosa MF-IS2 TaxID=1400762 RepID=A0A9P5XGA5_9AGAR|nr:imprinted and ancient [Macrolepiota fuliginosa MF-IS2]
MSRSSSSPSDSDDKDYAQELQDFIAELYKHPDREAVASEIEVLLSIYGENVIRVWHAPTSNGNGSADPNTIRYTLKVNLPSYDTVSIKFLVSLPPAYPVSSPPQLQLLSRYIGPFSADAVLFGSILRTFISVNGVEFTPETVCVFDGVQNVLERCSTWYEEHLNEDKAKEMIREDVKEMYRASNMKEVSPPDDSKHPPEHVEAFHEQHTNEMPPGTHFFVAEPIVDRKSSFIGRACRISDPSEVPQILAYLMSDRRIARAAHPIINAWRCQVGNILHQDNDDDGETAAGGRIAHLLQILEVNNVLVVVTRYFGGIHLGPDRFKHINQAARNALDLGGFLEVAEKKSLAGRGKRH